MNISISRRWALGVSAGAFALVLLAWSPRASAYAWMIRHDYTSCAMCHSDPSGGALLTEYGRAQGEVLLRAQWGRDPNAEPGRVAGFLFGAVKLPEMLLLGGDIRAMWLDTSVDDGRGSGFGPAIPRPASPSEIGAADWLGTLFMQTDLQGELRGDRLRASASLGFARAGALGATVVGDAEASRLVSRTHWIGVDIGEERNWLLRAGRLNIPFGVRMIEHTMWARSATRTDTNKSQQHGLALAYTGETWRGELMAILGNYQIHPDVYRERGYSGFLEYAATPHLAIGVSSLITHAGLDVATQRPMWRHAHGAFARWAPAKPLVLTAECNFVLYSTPQHNAYGLASFLQADVEPTQGLHLIGTLELQDLDVGAQGASLGAWAGAAWFFAPHADIRVDGLVQRVVIQSQAATALSIVTQLHLFL